MREDAKQLLSKEQLAKEAEAQEPVTFIFQNVELKGKRQQFINNTDIVVVEDGKKYTLPKHIVDDLENNTFPDYVIEGDVDGGVPTMKRYDRKRFFIKRVETVKAGNIEDARDEVLSKLDEPVKKSKKKTKEGEGDATQKGEV
jgi:hypothetical protein